jgi:transposase InsO family protein
MKRQGLQSKHTKRRFKAVTTVVDKQAPKARNLLERDFQRQGKNQVWCSDITYIPSNEGPLYLTIVMDLYRREVLAWNLSRTLQASATTVVTLLKALNKRRRQANEKSANSSVNSMAANTIVPKMFHSDRGVQYTAKDFRELLQTFNITQSMSRKGNCWDNAPAEAFFATLKKEYDIDKKSKYSFLQIKDALFRYIECFYNTQRIHSAINNATPI